MINIGTNNNHDFDFEDWDDTDLNGPGVEMDIDAYIAKMELDIRVIIPQELGSDLGDDKIRHCQQTARGEIGNLWIEKIKEWQLNARKI